MAEPVTKKIDTLPAMTGAVATNDKLLLLDVSDPATTMTKLITMNQVRISSTAQLDADVVETPKIKNLNVTGEKIASATITNDKLTTEVINDINKNLVYIQLFQTTESIINASNRTQFFVPAYLAGKSIRQIGMGVATSETGKNITIQLGTSGTYGSISGEATKEEAITKTLPAALTKIPINVTVTSGTPAPKGLDLWFLVY
jgi:hypothetical protein